MALRSGAWADHEFTYRCGRKGRLKQFDEPCWEPLIGVVGEELTGTFMWMHEEVLTGGLRLHAYKHIDTRRYLYLDEGGGAHERTAGDRFVEQRLDFALEAALCTWWMLSGWTEESALLVRDAILRANAAVPAGSRGGFTLVAMPTFTLDQPLSSARYDSLVRAGSLEGLRVELLNGRLEEMSPQGERHARVIQRLMRLFAPRVELLRVQMPLATEEGWVPEPDVALAEADPDPDRHPATALLVIEIAVTSHTSDRRKALTYARAEVPVYWLVDLPAQTVTVHSAPGRGGYDSVVSYRGNAQLHPGVAGVGTIAVRDLVAR